MSVNCRRNNDNSSKEIIYLKGSIEVVLGKFTLYFVSETHKPPLDVPAKESVMRHVTAMSSLAMSSEDLRSVIGSITVFARTAPKHKIAAFQANCSIVAITGDGGKSGSDVSREGADIILVNDEFVTILDAVKEGNSIFYNIRNFLTFQLSTSIAALTLITMSNVSGLPNPLNAMQILWITCDEITSTKEKCTNTYTSTNNACIYLRRYFVAGTLFTYITEMRNGIVTAIDTTMTFTCIVLFDMFNAVAFSLIGQLLVIYLPFFQAVFQTEALGLDDLFGLIVITLVFWIDEFRKIKNKRKKIMRQLLLWK
ncbi:hypothetical protein C2G38_2189016 [Gigaspora rosea]|uniref:Cation-transporting P-type ATPase C-terminal domain-containing protein n=1 Tax=Gigaspora rosea TaxID=44941 RepID=A0A397V624_9GLOM|nr:hypothetical protein C2G38_2189016 [Gigaspora rosea]CAG8602581.1 3584_t:CDS:2 [Gigaspora rosea]